MREYRTMREMIDGSQRFPSTNQSRQRTAFRSVASSSSSASSDSALSSCSDISRSSAVADLDSGVEERDGPVDDDGVEGVVGVVVTSASTCLMFLETADFCSTSVAGLRAFSTINLIKSGAVCRLAKAC